MYKRQADNQTAVDINVLQGERQFAKDNKSLGQFRLDGIPPARRGVPQIEVTFDIDANGIVNVSAKDLGTGKEQHITITAGSNMSDEDIDKAVKEAAEFEAQDKKRKEAIDARNDADSFVFQTEKALEEVGAGITDADKAEVQADLDALKALLEKHPDADQMSDAEIDEMKAAKAVSYTHLDVYKRQAGINRLSLGLQSADDRELKLLGRIHTYADFLESFDGARKEGFHNINVDLMSALPGQT